MKKLFAILMSIMMIACFMPTMAFAAEIGNIDLSATCDGETVEKSDGNEYAFTDKVDYSTPKALNVTVTKKEGAGTDPITVALSDQKKGAESAGEGTEYFKIGDLTESKALNFPSEGETNKAKFTVTPVESLGAGEYTATVTLTQGENTTSFKVRFTVAKKTLTADNFTFSAPTGLTYDGNGKTATVKAADSLTDKVGTIHVKYFAKDAADALEGEPTNAGEYTVKIDVEGNDTYNAATDLNADSWKFTIAKANQDAPESLVGVEPESAIGQGKITGPTTAMEYKEESDFTEKETGTKCSATDTNVVAGKTYYVRLAGDDNHNPSKAVPVEVPAYSDPAANEIPAAVMDAIKAYPDTYDGAAHDAITGLLTVEGGFPVAS